MNARFLRLSSSLKWLDGVFQLTWKIYYECIVPENFKFIGGGVVVYKQVPGISMFC